MNYIYNKTIKVNKKDIESDDEDFEDFEDEEEEVEEELVEEEIPNELYEEYDVDKIAYLFKNIELFSDKIIINVKMMKN